MAKTTRERTIAFFEVVQLKDGAAIRVSQIDWQDMLKEMGDASLEDRSWDGEHTFVGSVQNWHGMVGEEAVSRHLLLHRVKDAGEWLSRLDHGTGSVEHLESGQEQGFLETSAVSFLPFGNIVGMVQGSIAAPTHVSLQNWLNGIKACENTDLVVRPVVAQAEIERLQEAEGASKVEIRLSESVKGALKGKGGRLAKNLRRLRKDYGEGVSVTMVISVARGKGNDEARFKLLEDLTDLDDVMPTAAARARAKLVYSDDQGDAARRMVEFVEHNITAKAKIPAVNEKGETIRVEAAVNAILGQANQHETELRDAVDLD